MSIDLDKRITKGKKPLSAFDELESKYIGTDCFFSDKPSDFADLSKCQVGKLMSLDAVSGMFGASKNNSYAVFYFCLPCEWVKESEKKWRAYTIAEFQETFTVGRAVRFRRKDAPAKEHLLVFGGYYTLHNGRVSILFGIHLYTLEELFEQYEWQEFYTDEYRPFGIEE